MQATTCPICSNRNPPGDLRCLKCAADLTDPDVIAMGASEGLAAAPASLGEIGQLSSDKFFGVSRAKLLEGGSLRTISLFGGIALILAFLIPIPNAPGSGKWWMSWSVGKPLAGWAFWFPLVFGAAGVALAFVPKPDRWIRAIILAAMSLFGMLFIMPRLGKAGMAYSAMMPLFTIGLMAAACAITLRVYFPLEKPPRLAIIIASAIALIGMVIPMAKAGTVVPLEYSVFRAGALNDASLLGIAWESMDQDMMVRLISLYGLFLLGLLIGASIAAWPVPGGVWDKTSFFVRPAAWAVVLYLPFQKALLVFNVAGWPSTHGGFANAKAVSKFANALMLSRARMILLATVFLMWAVFSAAVLYHHFRPQATDKYASND